MLSPTCRRRAVYFFKLKPLSFLSLSTSSAANSYSSSPESVGSDQLDRLLRLYAHSPSKLSLALSSTSNPPSTTSLRHALKSLPLDSAFSLFSSLPPSLVSPGLAAPLLRRMATPRLLSKALQLLDEMPLGADNSENQKEEMFRCLVDALCKKGSVKEAADLFEHMRDRFKPDLRCFNSLLYGWCKLGKLEEAKYVLVQIRKCGFEPDIVVYNTLLGGFAAAGKMEDAYELMKDMREKGCEPNVISYTTVIQGLCTKGRMDEAMRVFVEMSRVNCSADSVTYSTLISGFCKSGDVKRGYDLLDLMVVKGLRLDPDAYFSLFIAHEQKDQLEEGLELLDRMNKSRCLPDNHVYNVLIRLACKLGELKQACDLWNQMESSGVEPSLDTFIIIINGLADKGDSVKACWFFKQMVEKDLFVTPHYGVLKTLLNSLVREGKVELAKEIWNSVVKSRCELNVCAWTIWIHALFSKRHIKEACMYCIEMLDAGLMPQPDTFVKLMKGLKKLYNRDIAKEITDKVRAMAAERGVSFKMYKRRGVRDLEMKLEAKRRGKNKGKSEKNKRISAQQGRIRAEQKKNTIVDDDNDIDDE
ncbi:Pentatricopeptide repeat-containing protein [Rhynchospora pubera]|uniref:Pentatricopeptide repeat-containing protein n=1 Tax=Rhynchospora pubera TaxID=906938 RepID=A0AAV8EP98_9POAL|nr:Pentatricopeptide repeat-containing protein [Rhynchospora pubera]